MKNFGKRVKIEVPRETEGHGGGDQRLRDLIFKKSTRQRTCGCPTRAPARCRA